MNLSIYLTPVNLNELKHERWGNYSLGKSVSFYQGEEDGEVHLRDYNIAIVGICEERNAVNNDGCGSAPNSVRNYLYQLSAISGINKILDLGNVLPGETVEDGNGAKCLIDDIAAVADVELLRKRAHRACLAVWVAGGSADAAFQS